MEHSNGAVKTAFDIQVDGKHGPGRPKMTWKQLTERDRREWKLSAIGPHDRDTWRSGVRSATHAASKLPGRWPTVVDMAPVPARYRIYPKYSDTLNVQTPSFFLKRHLFYVPYISGHVPYRVFLLSVNVRTPKTCPLFLIKLLFFTT